MLIKEPVKTVDDVFGEMEYIFAWRKTEDVEISGKEVRLQMVVESYSGQDILQTQRDAYTKFNDNFYEHAKKVSDALFDYYLEKEKENVRPSIFKVMENITKEKVKENMFAWLFTENTIFFAQDGQYAWLCDFEHRKKFRLCITLSDEKIKIEEREYPIWI